MSFIFKSVDTVDTISREDFKKNYLDPRKPLIIKNREQNGGSGNWIKNKQSYSFKDEGPEQRHWS